VSHRNLKRTSCNKTRNALSLLEVVLALAILGAAGAMLAQSMQVATDAGLQARDQAVAELLAESKMSEVIAGAFPPNQSSDWMPVVTTVDPGKWYFRIQSPPALVQGMLMIQVQITDDPQMQKERPLQFILTRWMIDPSLGLDTPPEDASSTTSGTGSGTGTSATSSSSGAL
jgi:type II secretory pathway pseudopilin PulG